MAADDVSTETEARGRSMRPRTVRVEMKQHGDWVVALPNGAHVDCETLDAAKRVVFLSAARRQTCDLIIHDAYHRVLYHEHIDGSHALAGAATNQQPQRSAPWLEH